MSTHELAQGYKDVQDQTVTVRFKITKAPEGVNDPDMANGKTYFLAWTTTPWTLPSNLGLCMGPEIDYVKILDKESGDYYIFAEARLSAYYKNERKNKKALGERALEPVLTIITGAFVLWFVIGFVLPLLSVLGDL